MTVAEPDADVFDVHVAETEPPPVPFCTTVVAGLPLVIVVVPEEDNVLHVRVTGVPAKTLITLPLTLPVVVLAAAESVKSGP